MGFILFSCICTVHAGDVCTVCDKGCVEATGRCPVSQPYLCKRDSFWPWQENCVAKGFDFGCCGGLNDNKGYCIECDQGCLEWNSLTPLAKDEYTEVCLGPDEGKYLCLSHMTPMGRAYCLNRKDYTDMGCCGGLPDQSKDETVTYLKAELTSGPCTSPIKFEVDGQDYTANCIQGYSGLLIPLAKDEAKKTVYCTTKKLPAWETGPHHAKITWCNKTKELDYGETPKTEEPKPKVKIVAHGELLPEEPKVRIVAHAEPLSEDTGMKIIAYSEPPEDAETEENSGVVIKAHAEPLSSSGDTGGGNS